VALSYFSLHPKAIKLKDWLLKDEPWPLRGFLHGFSFQCKAGLIGGRSLYAMVEKCFRSKIDLTLVVRCMDKKLNEKGAGLFPNMLRTGDMQSAIVR
jgi:hypothetical protein